MQICRLIGLIDIIRVEDMLHDCATTKNTKSQVQINDVDRSSTRYNRETWHHPPTMIKILTNNSIQAKLTTTEDILLHQPKMLTSINHLLLYVLH